MIIIADHRIPQQAKNTLNKIGEVLWLKSSDITYSAISGHPDIFICQAEESLIVAPNTPFEIKKQLNNFNINFCEGEKIIGCKYPETTQYNAIITDHFLIHYIQFTDPVILKTCEPLEKINVNQAYTRCSLLALPDRRYITSDRGIEQILKNKGLEILYVDPKGILLQGFDHGFFGGTCGVFENKVFITGNLNHFAEGEKVKHFLEEYEIIELYDGPLFDCGSLIFLK